MVVGNILLNGVGYVGIPFEQDGRTALVHRYRVDPLVPGFSEGGPNKLQNLRNVISLNFPNFIRGYGRRRIDSDSAFKPDEYQHFFDARADTRFDHGAVLPVLEEDSTGELESIRASARWKGALWTLWNNDASTDVSAREIDSSGNFTGGGDLKANSTASAAQDLLVYQDKLVGLYAEATSHQVMHSPDGVTWTAASTDVTGSLLANNVTAHESANFGLFAEVGDEAVAILWHESNRTITFFSSTNPTTWADEAIDIPAGSQGVAGVAVMPGIDGADKLYVLCDSGLWEIDTSPSTWTTRKIHGIPGSDTANHCRRLAIHQGALWITTSDDTDRPFDIIRMTNLSGERRIEYDLGLDLADGVPTALNGLCLRLVSAGPFLYAAVGGSITDRNAHIFCHNGKGWHFMVRDSTGSRIFPWIDVDGDNIHYAKRTAADAHTGHFLANGHANPRSGVSIKRASSGFVDTPYVDAGILDSGTWARVRINAEGLSATNSNEFINVDFGEDDGSGGLNAQSNTDLGDFLSGTATIDFASGAGISSVNMGLRVNLLRDATTNTDTPVLKDVQLLVKKKISNTQGFLVLIDLEASAELKETTSEAVITTLETANDLGTFPSFQYANITSTNVDVLDILWGDLVEAVGDEDSETVPNTNALRTGLVLVRLEEVV